MLAVENEDATVLGSVGWHAVRHGPGDIAKALNIGITLLPEQRGRGYGTAAQEALAHYLFQTTLVERLEAETDVDNLAEQQALEKAGLPTRRSPPARSVPPRPMARPHPVQPTAG